MAKLPKLPGITHVLWKMKKADKILLAQLAATGAFLWLVTRRRQPSGAPLRLWNTYYKLASAAEYGGPQDVTLTDGAGNPIAQVSQAFMRDFCMEGSGKLHDGRVVNFTSGSSYTGQCTAHVLDSAQFPWGAGVQHRALVPLRSIAVDPRTIAYGSSVYIREFDGLHIPSVGGVGGFTHDGCFTAADTGGAIRGDHIDIFAGPTSMYHAMENLIHTRTPLTAYVNSGRC